MGSSNSEEIIKRLKEALAASTDGQLATCLGISRQNIGAARKRDEVPTSWIYKVAELTGCSMDWPSFGQGPKLRAKYTPAATPSAGQVASPESPYGFVNVPQDRGAGELQPGDERVGFGAAVEMLAKIYSTGDSLLINAVNANIQAICATLAGQQPQRRSTTGLEDLKNRLTALEKQLDRKR